MNTMTNITVNDTIQPLLIDAQEYMRFSGRYYLCDVEYVQTSQAEEKCKLTLSDSSGTLEVYARYEQLKNEAILVDTMLHVDVATGNLLIESLGFAVKIRVINRPIT